MITLKGKKQDLTLIAIDGVKVPKFVSDADLATTLISEEKVVYMVLKKAAPDKRKQLKKALTSFVGGNKHNINIDVDSFIKVIGKDLDKEIIFNTIIETIGQVSFKAFSMKEKQKNNDAIYNLITSEKMDKHFEKEMIKIEATNFARVLQDTPPNIATSVYLAEKIVEEAKKVKGLKIKVLGKKEAEKFGMGLFLGVNAGSNVEPQAVVIEYVSDAKLPRTALVGKGITFDSGGYNLKPSQFMDGMKFDMSGAAIMLSTIIALAKAGAKANVVGIGMFTDNRIGGTATMPESVLKSMNGKTVEINNTDAEGRLVLADGMTYAIREMKAERIIEASTLTGAIAVALGPWFIGAFTTNDKLFEEFHKATEYTGELAWRMPILAEHLEKMQESKIADLTNSESGRAAGSSTAAAFLNVFAEEKPYLHLDIAATADEGKRGTGVLVKTLFELLNK
ncbi:leucyl aminopeptidase [Williamsoniiplasma somnilux]|uniref:Probable cytosol aminopeptidase n=1 Tax=Williamsoniiplasma somnilux TaxID=215578 RepID=A0A2K8NXD5_9MOLU|nr:M17 family metallopeptidase [Williamsoniiplasma somnilux]ATZ18502.1 leucyl aminopeptidase [Williamsoniiplasma somnilux]